MSYTCVDAYGDITSALCLDTPPEWDEDGLDHVSEETDLALQKIERMGQQIEAGQKVLEALQELLAYHLMLGNSEASSKVSEAREAIAKAKEAGL